MPMNPWLFILANETKASASPSEAESWYSENMIPPPGTLYCVKGGLPAST